MLSCCCYCCSVKRWLIGFCEAIGLWILKILKSTDTPCYGGQSPLQKMYAERNFRPPTDRFKKNIFDWKTRISVLWRKFAFVKRLVYEFLKFQNPQTLHAMVVNRQKQYFLLKWILDPLRTVSKRQFLSENTDFRSLTANWTPNLLLREK